jgi:hypothetical protein
LEKGYQKAGTGFQQENPVVKSPMLTIGDKQNPKSATTPNDPLYLDGSQWYLNAIQAPQAWELATGAGQVIAIIDTGVDLDHPDLDDNIWTNPDEIPGNGIDDDGNGYIDDVHGWDWINNDNDPNDDNSHGTHVAGIAAAEGNNGIGIIGVAFEAKILPLKVLQSSGQGSVFDVIRGIEYSSSMGVDVINMSLGTYAESLSLKEVLIDAYAKKVFLVAAAGNDNLKLLEEVCPSCGNMYPACYPFVLGVQASDQSGARAGFSNYDCTGPIDFTNPWGFNYELFAPGVNVISTIPGGQYRRYNGTSIAAPQIAGACAIIKQYWDFGEYIDQVWAKLIFSSSGPIHIKNALDYDLATKDPQLKFISFTLVDTLPGCDRDGRADAGETVEIWATLRNVGGMADSVTGRIDFGEFEDHTVATILDSSNYYGNISTWAWMDAKPSTIKIKIDSSVAHNRDIVFAYTIGDKSNSSSFCPQIVVNVEKGIELSGFLTQNDTLKSGYRYLINNSFRIQPNVTLYVEPGVEIILYDNKTIDVRGSFVAKGNKKNPIIIRPKNLYSTDVFSTGNGSFDLQYCDILGFSEFFQGSYVVMEVKLDNCIFEGFKYFVSIRNCSSVSNCIFKNLIGIDIFHNPNQITIFNNFINASFEGRGDDFFGIIEKNNFVSINAKRDFTYKLSRTQNNFKNNNLIYCKNIIGSGQDDVEPLEASPNYWGTQDSSLIANYIYDFWDDQKLGLIRYFPTNGRPDSLAHGIVWKVEINSINPFEKYLDPLGSGAYKFDVCFNRPMDIEYPPTVGFGVTDPFLQRIVNEDASWSADSTIWTAFYNIGPETGDGINTIHVRDAKDPEGFEIPPEYFRFKFKIQAAAAASVEFYATAGIGKVALEWPTTQTDDALGYNLYRYHNLTDSTFSDTVMINGSLLIDTVYSDYEVIPNITYHYKYKTVGTDLAETDFSKTASATPFNAANGDANGDLLVNVLDITTIVSYLLEQNPKPFLNDAADVNYDGSINILDIIGVIRIIQGMKFSIGTAPCTILPSALITLDDGSIGLSSTDPVTAIQFELTGSDLDQVKLFSRREGFEFSYVHIGNKIRGVMYTFSNSLIEGKAIPIIEIQGGQDIQWSSGFGATADGCYIPLKLATGILQPVTENGMKVYPNPFSHQISIKYDLSADALVIIGVYDIQGKLVKKLVQQPQVAGSYQADWQGGNSIGKLAPSGIYIIRMEINTGSGAPSEIFTEKVVKTTN